MFGRISLWAAGAVIAGLMLPAQAMAQFDAHTLTYLNLRVGPGTEYGVIDVIPAGHPVDVLGCLDAYEWCDIEWDGLRGWVSARYLVQPGTTVYLPDYAPRIGVPIISFSFFSYHDRYYRDRPWYRERHGRWTDHDWRDRDWDDDRDDDRDDDSDSAEDRARDQVEERQEAERPRQQRDVEEPRQQEREARPQQRDAEPPQPQQRDAERPQQREREAQQVDRVQRQGDRPQRGQRVQRRGNGGPPEELTNDRGQ